MLSFKYISIISILISSACFAAAEPAKKVAPPKSETPAPKETPPVSPSEGDLRLSIQDTKKLIDADNILLKAAEHRYNENHIYDTDRLKQQKIARADKREIKDLKKRMAVHTEMVKRWEALLINKTGKLNS